jgi:hypothetical protein
MTIIKGAGLVMKAIIEVCVERLFKKIISSLLITGG